MEEQATQEKTETEVQIPPGCTLFFAWIFTNAFGLGLGWLLGWWASFQVPGPLVTLTLGAVTGLVQGFFQWLVLNAHEKRSPWWIVATALGWAAGFSIGFIAGQSLSTSELAQHLIAGASIGLLLGIPQWLLLPRTSRRSFWWIPASVFAMTAVFMFYRPNLSAWGFYYGLLYGIPTSVALLWALYTETGTKPA